MKGSIVNWGFLKQKNTNYETTERQKSHIHGTINLWTSSDISTNSKRIPERTEPNPNVEKQNIFCYINLFKKKIQKHIQTIQFHMSIRILKSKTLILIQG